MKRTASIILIICMLLAALSLSACAKKENLDGTYQLISLVVNGEDMNEALKGNTVTLTIEGKQATASMGDQTILWQVDEENKQMIVESGQKASYRVEGKQLIVESDNDGKMVFEKQENQ